MWNDANKKLPDKDGDYLVVIKGATLPTVLSYYNESEVFYDEDHGCCYNVTHWCPLPEMPGATSKVEDDGGVIDSKQKFTIHFSLDEAITFRENLRFVLAYGEVQPYLRGKLGLLLQYFENVTGDRR